MKPKHVLMFLDREREYVQHKLEKVMPGSKDYNYYTKKLGALNHCTRLVAFEVQYVNTLKDDGEYANNRKDGDFLAEMLRATPRGPA